jgi:hypothetical protein
MQFHFCAANFSAIAFPKPEVAPVINMILFIDGKLMLQFTGGLAQKKELWSAP